MEVGCFCVDLQLIYPRRKEVVSHGLKHSGFQDKRCGLGGVGRKQKL